MNNTTVSKKRRMTYEYYTEQAMLMVELKLNMRVIKKQIWQMP